MPVNAQEVEAALRSALQPEVLVVNDDSEQHAGHAGAAEGSHFSVRVVSKSFNELSRLKRHRLVYDAVHFLIPRGIHALAIDAKAPDES